MPIARKHPLPDPSVNSSSDMTRLLCAGTRLDSEFARTVIRTLLKDRARMAAPAYGFDAVPVLGHALEARRLWRLRAGLAVVAIILIVLLAAYGPLGPIGAVLLCVWVTWAAVFVERLMSLQVLISQLKPPSATREGFVGQYPASDELTVDVVEGIAREQDTTGQVVYYGGYLPFVGAGIQVRQWSFAVLLDGEREMDGTLATPDTFPVNELMDVIQERLGVVLADEPVDGQRIEQLSITRRWYRKAVSARRPDILVERAALARRSDGPQLYDSAREYLCVQVGSWSSELITSVFVAFDVKGKTLHTELHGHVLPPIRPKFRLVDQLPEALDGDLVLRVSWQALLIAIRSFFRAPLVVLGGLAALLSWRHQGPSDVEDLTRYAAPVRDHGAEASVRELAAISNYRHFFQQIDAEKYAKIVERRLFELVIDFLAEHHIDTGEFRERQAMVLNYGIMHTGRGDIRNTGAMAAGAGATATTTK